MTKRILVTGANGFTGRYVCASFMDKNIEVYGLTRDCSTTGKSLDINDKDAVLAVIESVRPTSIVHLAAISNVDHGSEDDFFKVNVLGTENLLNCAKEKLKVIDNIVVASSANIYGSCETPIKEDFIPNPQNAYARSKFDMEKLIRDSFADLPVTIVRPFNYTGRGQSVAFLVPKIIKAFKEKENTLVLGNLGISRDFSDVRFIADAYVTLTMQYSRSETLNLCSGRSISLMSILEMCEKLTNHHLTIQSVSQLRRKNEIVNLSGDPAHMFDVLGYASPWSFFDTLKWMLS